MLEKEAEDFLEKEGFNVAKRAFISKKEQLKSVKLNYPLAMKVSSKKIVHKARAGGVILSIMNLKEAEEAFEKMTKLDGFEGVMLQEMRKGLFVILGLKSTPEFGLAIMFGKGGGDVEKTRDVSFRICPIEEKDAGEMMKETKFYKELEENKINISLIKNNLMNLSRLAEKHKGIKELDINPIIANEKEAVITDARIVL